MKYIKASEGAFNHFHSLTQSFTAPIRYEIIVLYITDSGTIAPAQESKIENSLQGM